MPRVIVIAFALAWSATGAAWPTKPITFIVPYPPGGGTDILGSQIKGSAAPVAYFQ